MQRIYLAIFLSMGSDVIMLDEPASALDEKNSNTLMENLIQYYRDKGISHDQSLANDFNALETALLPTLNSMLGMGIIFLPGMMTGQILSGTSPMTAIMYQIAQE